MKDTEITLREHDRRIARHDARQGGWLHRIARRLTRPFWRTIVKAPINRMYERGLLTSLAYHEAHAYADRLLNNETTK